MQEVTTARPLKEVEGPEWGYTGDEVRMMNKMSEYLETLYRRITQSSKGADALFTVPDEELGQAFLNTEEGRRLLEEKRETRGR